MDIAKVVIPAAGLGSRFLPDTAAIPKEMLAVLNKPAIQYIVEEGLASSIQNYLMIVAKGKDSIADYFEPSGSLQLQLEERGKLSLIADIQKIARAAHFSYIRQVEPLGLGHAIWMARHSIGKEYFGIMLPDDIIMSPNNPGLGQLIRIARQEKASVIAVQEVPAECISSYGIVAVKKQITPNLFQVSHLVEKPDQKHAPSNLAIIGRYVLSHKVFNSLEEISSYATGELQLTDAITHMMKNNEKVFAYKIQGTRYDVGTPVGLIKATIGLGLQDPAYGPHIKKFLNDLNGADSFKFNHTKNIEHTL
jgi:UTP--glucose-1-phosphate uridylyltransferase